MGRPRKLEADDRYNEESLNLDETTSEEGPRNPETDDMLSELGESDDNTHFDRLNDAALIEEGGF